MIVIKKSSHLSDNSRECHSVRTLDSGNISNWSKDLSPASHQPPVPSPLTHVKANVPPPPYSEASTPSADYSPALTASVSSAISKIPKLPLTGLHTALNKAASFDSADVQTSSTGYIGHGRVRVVIGHVGDCRAVLSDSGNAVELTTDHHPCMPAERARVEEAGGVIRGGRVNGVLAVTRSIGDIMYKDFDMAAPVPKNPLDESKEPGIWAKSQHVISKPDIVDFIVHPSHEFIVLASDGNYCLLQRD